MIEPVIYVYVLLAALGASSVVGLVIGRKSVNLLISLVFGIAIWVARIKYDPDPAALPGFVGYPLMCIGMNRLGGSLRRRIRSGSKKGNDHKPPVTR